MSTNSQNPPSNRSLAFYTVFAYYSYPNVARLGVAQNAIEVAEHVSAFSTWKNINLILVFDQNKKVIFGIRKKKEGGWVKDDSYSEIRLA